MEMHSRKSLYDIHGISTQPRWRVLARLGIARILAVLKGITKAIEAELAVRRAITELTSMDDRMLRDLGITRGEIQNTIRGPRKIAETDDAPLVSSDTSQHHLALPVINSPDLSSEGRPAAVRGDCARGDQFEPARWPFT